MRNNDSKISNDLRILYTGNSVLVREDYLSQDADLNKFYAGLKTYLNTNNITEPVIVLHTADNDNWFYAFYNPHNETCCNGKLSGFDFPKAKIKVHYKPNEEIYAIESGDSYSSELYLSLLNSVARMLEENANIIDAYKKDKEDFGLAGADTSQKPDILSQPQEYTEAVLPMSRHMTAFMQLTCVAFNAYIKPVIQDLKKKRRVLEKYENAEMLTENLFKMFTIFSNLTQDLLVSTPENFLQKAIDNLLIIPSIIKCMMLTIEGIYYLDAIKFKQGLSKSLLIAIPLGVLSAIGAAALLIAHEIIVWKHGKDFDEQHKAMYGKVHDIANAMQAIDDKIQKARAQVGLAQDSVKGSQPAADNNKTITFSGTAKAKINQDLALANKILHDIQELNEKVIELVPASGHRPTYSGN